MSGFWSLHTHSRFSANDAMSGVEELVDRAVELGYPALGLTDHGGISGSVDLYKACRKAGIEPLPGIEIYLNADRSRNDRKNYHLTINAYTEAGYRNLVALNNQAQRQFYFKPMLDIADLAAMAEAGMTEGLTVSTGCYFGLAQQLVTYRGPEAAKQAISALAGWFPRVYVELHNHGVVHGGGYDDASMSEELVCIADELGLPYIIALDAHYTHAEQQPLHNGLKGLVTWSDDPDEALFPGGPYSLESGDSVSKLFPSDVYGRAADALADLADAAHVRLPELESFSLKVPDVTAGGDPNRELRRRIATALDARSWASKSEEKWFRERADTELETITVATMPGYILLVDDLCKFMTSQGIWFQARGSAGGSAVTMLLGITQVSPRRWKLFMERFMSKDRTRPPDIDLDVEHLRRAEAIAWLDARFAVRQVGSYTQYSLSEDEDAEEDDSKGSLMRRYFTSSNKRGVKINEWRDIPKADQKMLRELGSMKLIGGYGTHAAGFIVAPDEISLAQLPLVWLAKPKKFNTAFDKKGVEALGFCKLDLLGLRNLTARRITLEAICEKDPSLTPPGLWNAIPDRDPEVSRRLAQGLTAGVFQLDGKTNTRGAREMKPRSIDDVVAMQALYRPALLQAHDDKLYLARRAGEAETPQRHPDVMAVTEETYGILLYQEQIISLLRAAGMPPDELTDTLDAVKASNAATAKAKVFFEKTLPRINQLVADRGWSQADMDWFLGGLKGYAEYSFNKAHSAQYGEAAWRSAWLSAHYPIEFWYGVLNAYWDHKRIRGFMMAARRQGVKVLPPHVNLSGGLGFRLETGFTGQVVRQGLTQIAHIGPATATELVAKQPFASLKDLGERCLPSRVSGAKHLAMNKQPLEAGGAVAALFAAGALDGLE